MGNRDKRSMRYHGWVALALVVTVQLCAVSAEEAVPDDRVLGDAAMVSSSEMFYGKKKSIVKVPVGIATAKKIHKPKEDFKSHAKELAKADAAGAKAAKKERAAIKNVAKTVAPIDQLVAKFEHTLDPKKAAKLKKEIEDRRAKAFSEQKKANDANTALSHAKYKSKYHKAELARQKVLSPPSKKMIVQKTTKKLKAKYLKKTQRLRTHVGMIATAAQKQALQNKALIGKISKFANKKALQAAKAKRAKHIKTLKKQLNAAVKQAANAKTAAGGKAAGVRVKSLQTQLDKLEGKKKRAKKKEPKDPIFNLTTRGRMHVMKLRKKIKQARLQLSNTLKTMQKKMKRANKMVSHAKLAVLKTRGKKLLKIHKQLKKWVMIRFQLQKSQKKAVVSQKEQLKKLETEEKHLLRIAPKVVKPKPKIVETKAMKKAKKAAKQTKKAARRVAREAKVVTKKQQKKSKAKAKVLTTEKQIAKLEAAHAATPRRRHALKLAAELVGLKKKRASEMKAEQKAKAKADAAKELARKKKQVLINDKARAMVESQELNQKKKKAKKKAAKAAMSVAEAVKRALAARKKSENLGGYAREREGPQSAEAAQG